MKKIRLISIILIISVLSLSTVIFIMSSQTSEKSSDTSGGVCEFLLTVFDSDYPDQTEAEKLDKVESLQFFVRKAAHFSAYAVLSALTLLAALSFYLKAKLSSVIALSYSLIFSITDEIHQSFVPGRSCEIRDVLIDFCGAITGTIIILIIRAIVKKRLPR